MFEVKAKLEVESGKTMALTMQLAERDMAMEKLKSKYEQQLKEKEAQLVVMAKAQSLSNQRAITAEAAMNEFLANPLAGMAFPGSPHDAKIQQLQRQIDEDKLFKGLMVNKLTKITKEKEVEVAES